MRPLGFANDKMFLTISDTKFQPLFFGIPNVIRLFLIYGKLRIYSIESE